MRRLFLIAVVTALSTLGACAPAKYHGAQQDVREIDGRKYTVANQPADAGAFDLYVAENVVVVTDLLGAQQNHLAVGKTLASERCKPKRADLLGWIKPSGMAGLDMRFRCV